VVLNAVSVINILHFLYFCFFNVTFPSTFQLFLIFFGTRSELRIHNMAKVRTQHSLELVMNFWRSFLCLPGSYPPMPSEDGGSMF
jgi:hypothetical protein